MCRRSQRRGLRDAAATLLGLRPWRCETCNLRFYGWSVPISFVAYAHCRQCGNLNLQRVTRDRVDQGPLRWLWRTLRFPALRCERCRRRFFSILPNRHIEPSRVRETAGS